MSSNPQEAALNGGSKSGWSYPPTFWYANGAELLERLAFYGMHITLMRYLNQEVGFTDKESGFIVGTFASVLYFLPTFMGIMADKIGFKQALMIAFALLTGGYTLLGALTVKPTVLLALGFIMLGGAIIKPVIAGTVAKCSDEANRARAMSIFYMMVNIGSFTGKAIAASTNDIWGLRYINFYSATASFLALVLVAVFYRDVDTTGTGKSLTVALEGLFKVMRNWRFLALIAIVGGFWSIQGQLYAAMPTYMERLVGPDSKPEWFANINPAVVVLLVVPITHLIRYLAPPTAIGIGLFIIPFTALIIALAPMVEQYTGSTMSIFGVWEGPVLLYMVAAGVALQGLAECFLSPKFLEYASKQAPPGEVGLYLGYQHLTTCFSWLFGFIMAGFLLDAYCPDPDNLSPTAHAQWETAIAGNGPLPDAYAHANYLWYVFAGVGFVAFLGLIVFQIVTKRIDAAKKAETA